MTWELWVGAGALVASLVVLVGALVVYTQALRLRRREGRPGRVYGPGLASDEEQPPPGRRLVAFVANPSKPGVPELRDDLVSACLDAALPEPLWFETTIEDPGRGQARRAVELGADIVVAVGGDGTVRAVAESLVGTRTAMGILPRGTGNLLARNLDIPTTTVADAMAVILGGHDRHIDVGRLRVERYEHAPEAGSEGARDVDHVFLVIAGLGFDAAMVADADDTLKKKMGWVAYFLAGVRHLHGRRMRITVGVDDLQSVTARMRSIMVGNCGRLPGGINLIPDAVIDDGRLDVVAIDARAGLVGWVQVFGEVVMQGMGVRNDLPAKVGRIETVPARQVLIEAEGGEHVQVDGDLLGVARVVRAWVEPRALVVRSA
ncbi:diacylglycerol/lipid kinase family protein [Luteimicrobium subarcticum]|uniref:Diacylglycerol kinase family enzyme n=1 Tax=Luteimicrobium subarcticum TaxID=620910 RepID=A0A2M8W734_9MICO|nr:diacylglycerol kinase family protein [Luteimicrobium subarcticum]PJI86745.1 diacylglycerol kinase family enzyme [Luteimicrobium subarcticum]